LPPRALVTAQPMPVTVIFANGTERPFPEATTAFSRGGMLVIVGQAGEASKFDLNAVVVATVRDEHGAVVENVPGKAQPG